MERMKEVSNQSYHHENLKAELIREGLLILDQEGYEGFSLRKVAKACNVSQTAPYRHFKNKDDLINAIIHEAIQAFNESLEEAVMKYPDDAAKQLKEMGVCYIRFFSKNPEYLHLLFSSNILDKMKADEKTCASIKNHEKNGHPFATFYQAIQKYAAAFPDKTTGESELMLYCWGLVHGISFLISNKGKLPYQGDCLELAEKIIWNENFLR